MFSEARVLKLIIEDDEGHTTVVPLVKPEITIGRKEGNTIRLTERNVSRRHAQILKDNGSVFIEDLDSYNGVKVNGDRIKARAPFREGDLIEIGDYHIALQYSPDEVARNVSQPPPLSSDPPTQPNAAKISKAPKASKAEDTFSGEVTTEVVKLPVTDKQESQPPAGTERVIPDSEACSLAVVSTELAGSVFMLNRDEIVIGRTEDNDIVISHRSVSGSHAKIVYDGGIYRIVDLDSANGVLVNGEEYSRVDLRRGDIIELGHVKIRFLVPGDQLPSPGDLAVTQPEMVAESLPEMDAAVKSNIAGKKVFLIGGGLILVLVVAFGIMQLVGTPDNADLDTKVEATKAEVKTEPVASVAKKEDPSSALLQQGKASLKAKQYPKAVAAFENLLKQKPNHAEASKLLKQANIAVSHSALVADTKTALSKQDVDTAWELIEQVPANSPLGQTVDKLRSKVKQEYISYHLDMAAKMKDSDVLEKAIKHVDSVLFVDQANHQAMKLKKIIEAAMTSKMATKKEAAKPAPVKVSKVVKTQPKKSRDNNRRKKNEIVKELVDKGTGLIKNERRYQEAINVFSKVIKLDPKHCGAYLSIGIAYAHMNKIDKAAKYYQKYVDICPTAKSAPQARQMLKQYYDSKK
jgi:pSer/pThr/pTyr-binding forkhead associated (FHA) protein